MSKTKDELVSSLLSELDSIARNHDHYEYGLPLHHETTMVALRLEVEATLEAAEALRNGREEKLFKDRFVANMMSSWCAQHYDEACASGRRAILEQPPSDDAIFLADQAWKRLQELKE